MSNPAPPTKNDLDTLKIEKLIQSGKFKEAFRTITRYQKKGLDNTVRFQCSLWYFRMGLPEKSLTILNSEVPREIMEQADFDTFRLQARLAFVLSYLGAKNYALRILKELEPVLAKRVPFQNQFNGSFYSYFGNTYIRAYDYKNAHDYYKKAMEAINPQVAPYVYLVNKLTYAYSLEATGHVAQALELAQAILNQTQEEQIFFKAICYLALGEFKLRSQKLAQARNYFDQAEALFGAENESLDFGFLKKWQGILFFLEKKYTQAQTHLNTAYQILNKKSQNPAVILEVLFWLNQLNEVQALKTAYPLDVCKTHPSRNPYGVLLDRNVENYDPPLHPWILSLKNRPETAIEDTWRYCDGKITAINYRQYWQQNNQNKKKTTIDLQAGIIQNPGTQKNLKWRYEFISEVKTKSLTFILGCGDLGANFWGLADFIYPNEKCILNFVQMRIKNIIKEIRKSGFDLEYKDHKIYWRPPTNTNILWPMNYRHQGVAAHLSCFFETFSRNDLEKFYHLPTRTASNWLDKWLGSNELEKMGSGSNSKYKFRI